MASRERRESSAGGGPGGQGLAPGEREALLEALTRGLEEALPGVLVLDRDLVLDEGVRAELAAVDPCGRLVLVQLAGADPDGATIALLDLLAWSRENAPVLARHLASRALRPELPARAVVVVAEGAERLRRRLEPLAGSSVELFCLRTVQSASSERVYLAPLRPPGAAAAPPGDPGDLFVGGLPGSLQDLGRRAVDRIARLDDELVAQVGQDSIAWRFRGEALVRLERSGDRLRASLGPEHEVHALRGAEDLDQVLEGALERLVPLFQGAASDASPGGRLSAEEEPLLSAEELEAFREP